MRRTKMGAAESAGSAIQRELPTGDKYNAHQHGRSVGTRSIWNERNGSPPYMSRQADKFKSIVVIILPNEKRSTEKFGVLLFRRRSVS